MTKLREAPIPERALVLSEELRTVLKHLVRELRRENSESDHGIPTMQYMLLAVIHEQPGIGVAELARMENVRGATISGHIKGLEAAGLVERAPDPDDRRRSGLKVSAHGLRAIEDLRSARRDWMARRIARLTPTQIDALAAAIAPLNEIAQP
jgi:DNA-binding MarR family transcriptional regulator